MIYPSMTMPPTLPLGVSSSMMLHHNTTMINVLSLTLHHHDHQHHGHQEHSRNILWSFLVFAWFIITMQYVIHVLCPAGVLDTPPSTHQGHQKEHSNIWPSLLQSPAQQWCLPAPPTTSSTATPTDQAKQLSLPPTHHLSTMTPLPASLWFKFKHLAARTASHHQPLKQLKQSNSSPSSHSHTTISARHHQHSTQATSRRTHSHPWCNHQQCILPAPAPSTTQMIMQSNSHHSHHTAHRPICQWWLFLHQHNSNIWPLLVQSQHCASHHSPLKQELQQRSNSSRSHTTVCQWLLHHQHQQPPPASTTTFNHTISTLLQQTTALPSSTPQFKLSQHLLLLKLPRTSTSAYHLPPLPQNCCHKSSCCSSFSPIFSVHSMLHCHNYCSHLIQHTASSFSRSPLTTPSPSSIINQHDPPTTNTHSTAPTPTNIHSNSIKEIMIFCCWLSHDSTTKIMIWLLSNDHDQKPPLHTNINSSILQIIWICDAIHHTLTLYHHQPPPKPSTFKHLAIITNVTAVQPPTTPPVQLKIKQSKGTKQQKPAKEFPTRFYCILCAALYSDCMIIGTFQ